MLHHVDHFEFCQKSFRASRCTCTIVGVLIFAVQSASTEGLFSCWFYDPRIGKVAYKLVCTPNFKEFIRTWMEFHALFFLQLCRTVNNTLLLSYWIHIKFSNYDIVWVKVHWNMVVQRIEAYRLDWRKTTILWSGSRWKPRLWSDSRWKCPDRTHAANNTRSS